MISIDFVARRLAATVDVQQHLVETVPWTWSEKPLLEWKDDKVELQELQSLEGRARTEWRFAAGEWDGKLAEIQRISREVRQSATYRFRKDQVRQRTFARLHTDARNRADIYDQGKALEIAWTEADPGWSYSTEVTLASFGDLLMEIPALKKTHDRTESAWKTAAARVMTKARTLDPELVAWHDEATRRFPAHTIPGSLLRTVVPTTTRSQPPVKPAVIVHVTTVDGTIHFDCFAPRATRYTYLHQPPGAETFVTVAADTAEASLTLHDQPPGLHRFKAFGSNSRGSGGESAVAEVMVVATVVAGES